MDIIENSRIPFALFNSKACFNPCQYLPFLKILDYSNDSGWKWNRKNVLIADEVGVGKTIEAGIILREFLKSDDSISPTFSALIICPVKLCKNWKNELSELFGINAENYRETKEFNRFTILPFSYFTYHGNDKTNNFDEEVKSEDNGNSNEIENNSNAVSNNNIDEIEKLVDAIPNTFDMIIIDEAHYLRNAEGMLYKAISLLLEKKQKYENGTPLGPRIFMTGTPIVNEEQDIINLLNLLNLLNPYSVETTSTTQGVANCYDFKPDISQIDIDSSDGLLSINQYLRDNSFGKLTMPLRRMAASCVYTLSETVKEWLEDKNDSNESTNHIKEAKKAIEENREELEKLDQELDSLLSEKDTKFEALLNKLNDLFNDKKEKKAVIFCCFKKTVQYLSEKLKQEGFNVFCITGDTNASEVDANKEHFEETHDPAVLICSDSAKEGHNLQFCHNLIHYDYPFTAAALAQRIGRVYRRGQSENPKIVYMHIIDSYDDRLYEIVFGKAQLTKDVDIVPLDVFPSEKSYSEMVQQWFMYSLPDVAKKTDDEEQKNLPKENSDGIKSYVDSVRNLLSIDKKIEDKVIYTVLEELRKTINWKESLFYTDEVINKLFSEKDSKVDRQKIFDANVAKYKEIEDSVKENLFGVEKSNNMNMKEILTKCKETALGDVTANSKFCDEMYINQQDENTESTKTTMSLDAYKEQFVPLYDYKNSGEEDEE